MWVNSKCAAEILGVNLRKLQRTVVKAQDELQKNLIVDTKNISYKYIDGIGRGGKTLQIWIDDNLINGENGENGEISQQSAPAPIKNSAGSEDKCLEPAPSAPQNERSDARRSRSGVSCERSEVEQNAPSLKIKDIEKMNKLKAVNELKSCPAGMSKTLWGKGVAAKYEVSLKTLYSWAKLFKQSEVEVKNDELSIDFKAKFKSSSFEMSALEWAVGFMLHNPLASKSFAYEQLQSYAKDNALKIGSYQSFARLTAAPEIKAMLLRASCGDRGVRNEWAMHIIRDLN